MYFSVSALQFLAETSTHEVVRSQARGALWILEGKEQKMPPSATEVSSLTAGSLFTVFTFHNVSTFSLHNAHVLFYLFKSKRAKRPLTLQ